MNDWIWFSVLLLASLLSMGSWFCVLPIFVSGMYFDGILLEYKKRRQKNEWV